MMLILFQSFSAVANSLDFHIVDLQHSQHEHSHETDNKPANKIVSTFLDSDIVLDTFINSPINSSIEKTDSQHSPADCHHCGHCSGSHAQWVSQHTAERFNLALQTHQFYFLQTVINGPVNQLLRPPKA